MSWKAILGIVVLFGLSLLFGAYQYPNGIDPSCIADQWWSLDYDGVKNFTEGLGVVLNTSEMAEIELHASFTPPVLDYDGEDICFSNFIDDLNKSEQEYKPKIVAKVQAMVDNCKRFG